MPVQLQRIAAGCAALILSAVAIPSHAQQIVVSKDNRTIAVTTSADANADADTVTVQIGFVAPARLAPPLEGAGLLPVEKASGHA